MKSQWVYLQIFSNLDMITVFFLYILKSYKERNLVEWIKAFSTLKRKKVFFVWLQLRVLSDQQQNWPSIDQQREIRNIYMEDWGGTEQSDHPQLWCCRSRNLIVEMISSQLAHKYRGRQTWGWRPSDMIRKQTGTTRLTGQASNWSSANGWVLFHP